MLRTARNMSSFCTGVFTAEVAVALVAATVNGSEMVDFMVNIRSRRCHDSCLHWS